MLSIGTWKEKNIFLVHIRDFVIKNKKYIHCPKGIALTINVWKTLFDNISDINKDIEEYYDVNFKK